MADAALKKPAATTVEDTQDLTDGFYESVCVIPNACDTGDEVWVTVRRRLLVTEPAATLTPDALASYDCVLIATHHKAYDWQQVADHARLIIDTRNALQHVVGRRDHIVRA